MGLQWRDNLATGNEDIDEQHQEMFRRYNRLLAACKEGYGKEEARIMLIFLGDYVKEHFSAEERLQIRSGYPGYSAHRQMHAGFVKTLRDLEEQLRTDGATVSLVIQTNQILADWLTQHISGADKELADFLKQAE
jgi:hemerythrin